MIEYRVDFVGGWPLWQKICHAFYEENGYWVDDEMPGWIRATELIHDVRIFRDEHHGWAVLYFNREEELTAFLLKWA